MKRPSAFEDVGTGKIFQDQKPIRALIAKPGLDGHSVGAKVIAFALRDAGMEVIYTGIRQTADYILDVALQEDVDVLGLSILSGAHMALCRKIMNGLRENGMEDTLVILGGIIPEEDIPVLHEMGIAAIFGPGSDLGEIVTFIQANVRRPSAQDMV
jgi:methylmalonyl-CoA mutase C-terminal domain/subunit